jgi:hypothetical protein
VFSVDGTFQAGTAYPTASGPDSLDVGDINGDGILDLVTANASSNNVSVLLGSVGGVFQNHTDHPTNLGPQSILIADFNRNGKLDMAVADSQASAVTILTQ